MKRVTLFSGHYGSGKTNIAINYALKLRGEGKRVIIADLDIVNPYFRTKDSQKELEKNGIEVISLSFANTNVDLPSLPSSIYRLVQDRESYSVIDLGGDDRGFYALGRLVPYIKEEGDYDMFYVVNFYRPLTQKAEDALEILREIESVSSLPFTGIINNSNLASETDRTVIEKKKDEALRLSELANLPIVYTTVEKALKEKDEFGLLLQRRPFEEKRDG